MCNIDSHSHFCLFISKMLFLFLIIFLLKENADANTINPLDPEKRVTAGDNVTLTCDYSGGVNTLQWYRQYPGSRIEFLIFVTELKGRSEPALRLSSVADERNKRMNLSIFQTEMEDSALYYCALVPTVTGNTATLYKNLTSLTADIDPKSDFNQFF
ncbi:hypothetical protein cypCar_00002418, partial [Cyprinus carpio]